jgi:hypothetical protein
VLEDLTLSLERKEEECKLLRSELSKPRTRTADAEEAVRRLREEVWRY